MDSASTFVCPNQTKVFSRFGTRRGRSHQGVDLPLRTGTPVYAAFDGRVRLSAYNSGYGNLVIIRHENGLEAPPEPELFDYIACSPKADYAKRYQDAKMLRRANEVRIVAETELIAPFCRSMRERIAADDYYISPLEQDGRMHYRRALNLLTKVNRLMPDAFPPWALSLQMHKVIGIR